MGKYSKIENKWFDKKVFDFTIEMKDYTIKRKLVVYNIGIKFCIYAEKNVMRRNV